MNKSNKLDGIKKQKVILVDRLKALYDACDRPEAKQNEKADRFIAILSEANLELDYVNKHIDRMEKSNGVKRQFIKGNVRKKFKESSERVGK